MTHSENTGKKEQPIPSLEELSGELRREKFRRRYRKLLRSTIYALVVVAAVSVLIATLLLPVLEIYGTSMKPNLTEGDIVVSVKSPSLETGDVIAFYYNNRVLVKRVIATGGQTVDIDFETGAVYVDGTLLEEDYINELTFVEEGTEFPLTVPEGCIFVMGDNRNDSDDSRDSTLGPVDTRCVLGRALLLAVPGPTADTEQRDWSRVGILN